MLFSVQELQKWDVGTLVNGRWVPARPWVHRFGRLKHAWWVLTGRCDAVWWPQDGNPHSLVRKRR